MWARYDMLGLKLRSVRRFDLADPNIILPQSNFDKEDCHFAETTAIANRGCRRKR